MSEKLTRRDFLRLSLLGTLTVFGLTGDTLISDEDEVKESVNWGRVKFENEMEAIGVKMTFSSTEFARTIESLGLESPMVHSLDIAILADGEIVPHYFNKPDHINIEKAILFGNDRIYVSGGGIIKDAKAMGERFGSKRGLSEGENFATKLSSRLLCHAIVWGYAELQRLSDPRINSDDLALDYYNALSDGSFSSFLQAEVRVGLSGEANA